MISKKSANIAVFPKLAKLIVLNQNSTISLTDDKNSCYYGLNNDKGFGWVLNSTDCNLYEITLKSYYYIISGSSTYQISSSEKIRVASCKLIEVKYPNVFFAADSVIEINPSFGVSKSAKQTFDVELNYSDDMLVLPIHHLTSVCLSVHNSEFTDDHTNYAKLTSILEEYNPFVYWNLRLLWQICKSSILLYISIKKSNFDSIAWYSSENFRNEWTILSKD